MWSLAGYLLSALACVIYYGGKGLPFVICATCWGAYVTVMAPFWLLGLADWPYRRA